MSSTPYLRALHAERDALKAQVLELAKLEIAAYVKGWAEGVRSYAVWSDGEQLVGIMRKPLFDVLEEGPDLDVLALRLAEEE